MDTGDSYRGGGRGGYDNRAYDSRRQDGGRGGGGGGRGYYPSDRGYSGRGGGRGGGWQQSRGNYNDFEQGGGRGGGRGRGRYQQNWGRGSQRNNVWERGKHDREEREEESLPPDVAALTELTGHTDKVKAITYDATTQQLYTGSIDGSVRTWSTVTGQCVASVEVGGEVDSLLLGGGYLFVGMHKGTEGIIKVWNMATGASHLLTGHKGQVLSLAIASSALVSAGQDNTIRVWNFNQQAEIFMSQAIIGREDGGHTTSVHALCVMGNFMFSADREGNILVWDLSTGKVVQRLAGAHDNQPVMQLLAFENVLLSAGMDGLIKAWQLLDQPLPATVLRPEPLYIFDKENSEGADGTQQPPQHQQFRGQRRQVRTCPGIITMTGTTDASGTPVLMVAYNNESCVRLFQLPEFNPRGVLTPTHDTRALGSVAGTVMLTGDGKGGVRVFQWK